MSLHKIPSVGNNNNNRSFQAAYDMPPKNYKSLRTSECLDTMNFDYTDDWVDYDIYDLRNENNEITNVERMDFDVDVAMSSEKNSPTKESSKNPNEVFSESETFNQLLENLNDSILNANLMRFHKFLESTNKEMSLPYVSQQYEEVFKNITRDVDILKSKNLNSIHTEICSKIIKTVKLNKSIFFLTFIYKSRKEYNVLQDILVIQKVYLKNEPVRKKTSLQCSLESLLSSEMSSEMDPDEILQRSPTPDVSNSFKLHYIKATLAFVKNHLTQKIEFPELNSEQADFMQLLLQSVVCLAKFDNEFDIKDWFRALWEAVKIHSLKYEFKVNSIDWGETKSLVFEKVVKRKPTDTEINLDHKPNQIPQEITKKQLKIGSKFKQEAKFINSLPRPFILNTLNATIDFLTDENVRRIKLASKNTMETRFYRSVIEWGRGDHLPTGDPEYKPLFEKIGKLLSQIKIKVPSGKKHRRDVVTGIQDISFIKKGKILRPTVKTKTAESITMNYKRKNTINEDVSSEKSVTTPDKRVSKNKKIKLQDVLNSDRAAETPLNNLLNMSLRNKKKNKKPKRDKLKTSKENLFKTDTRTPCQPEKPDTPNDLGKGQDINQEQLPTKMEPSEHTAAVIEEIRQNLEWCDQQKKLLAPIIMIPRDFRRPRVNQKVWKKELIEAMSVPVQSDKAVRIMRGMGWSGGALGVRGGITEPIMPALEFVSGAGLGMRTMQGVSKGINKENERNNKFKKSKPTTKIGPNWVSEQSKQIVPEKLENDIIVQKTKQLLEQNYSLDTLIEDNEPGKSVVPKNMSFRYEILSEIHHLLSSNDMDVCLSYETPLNRSQRGFLKYATKTIRHRCEMSLPEKKVAERDMATKMLEKLRKMPVPGVNIEASISKDWKEVVLMKIYLSSTQMKDNNKSTTNKSPWAEPLKSAGEYTKMPKFSKAVQKTCPSKNICSTQKFRVLILLKILEFLRSDDEEIEVTFDKCVPISRRKYINSVIDSVNSRLQFGCSPTETEMTIKIKNIIGDKWIGVMFNHHYTSFTLTKYVCLNEMDSLEVAPTKHDDFSLNIIKNTEGQTNRDNNNDKNIGNNNNEMEKEVVLRKDSVVADVISKLATENKSKLLIAIENAAVQAAKDNVIANVENDNSELIATKTTDEHKENCDINIDCYDNLVTSNENDIDRIENRKIDSEIVLAKDTAIADEVSEASFQGNKDIIVDSNNCVTGENNEGIDNTSDKIADDNSMELEDIHLLDKGSDSMIDSEINTYTEEILDEEMSNNESVCTNITFDLNEDDIINILSGDDYIEKKSTTENIDLTMKVNNIDEKIEATDDEVNKVGDERSEAVMEINMKEDKLGIEELKGELLQTISARNESTKKIFTEEDNRIIHMENDDMKKVSQEDQLKERNIEDVPLKEIIKGDETKKIITVEQSMEQLYSGIDLETEANVVNVTDCNSGIHQIIDLSKELCDDEHIEISDIETVPQQNENPKIDEIKSEIKNVYLVPTNYPDEKMTIEKARPTQKFFSDKILEGKDLPLLRCHGVQNGALIYSCHNENTFDWLKNKISVASEIKMLDIKNVRKMALKFYCLFDCDVKYLFNMLEMYNKDLSTAEWVVEKMEVNNGYATFLIEMDPHSINLIQSANCSLFAGIDEVEFNPMWD